MAHQNDCICVSSTLIRVTCASYIGKLAYTIKRLPIMLRLYPRCFHQSQRLPMQMVNIVLAIVQMGRDLIPSKEGDVPHLQQRLTLHAVHTPDRFGLCGIGGGSFGQKESPGEFPSSRLDLCEWTEHNRYFLIF